MFVISPLYEAFYIESMYWNSYRSVQALRRITQIEEHDFIDAEGEEELLFLLREFITNTASVARYLWPSRNTGLHADRGEYLRRCLCVDDNSPFKDRRLRNALEHFDERMDKFFTTRGSSQFIAGVVIPTWVLWDDDFPDDSDVPSKIFQGYSRLSQKFRVLDETFEVAPLFAEAMYIHSALQWAQRDGNRFRGRLIRVQDFACRIRADEGLSEFYNSRKLERF